MPKSKPKTQDGRNALGLTRHIPEKVAREVRRRAKFGCVLCRCGFYDYHHFDPPYALATRHDPAGICLLCPSCHASVHRGMTSVATIKARYEAIQRMRPAEAEPPAGPLDFHGGAAELVIGGLHYNPMARVVLRYHGEELIRVDPGENGEPGAITALLTDSQGNPALRLARNAWIGPTDPWDIRVVGNRISVLGGPGQSSLTIRTEPPGKVVIEHLDMRYRDAHVLATEHAFAVGRYRPRGDVFWVSTSVRITRSTPAGAAIEFMTPSEVESQDRATRHGSTALATADGSFVISSRGGVLFKAPGIAIASLCGGIEVRSTACGVAPLDYVRRLIQGNPELLRRYIATGRTF